MWKHSQGNRLPPMKLVPTRNTCLLPLLFWVTASFLLAQKPPLGFSNFTEEDGLSQGSGNIILQDTMGFIWVATQDGLNRFDGYRFQSFKHEANNPDSLPGNWINAMFRDSQDRIFIGTSEGLARLDTSNYRFVSIPLADGSKASISKLINCFGEDNSGRIWVGTSDGISIFDATFTQVKRIMTLAPSASDAGYSYIEAFAQDSRHQRAMWVATRGGGLYHVVNDQPTPIQGLPSHLLCISKKENGALWIGSLDKGLFYFDPESGRIRQYLYDQSDPTSIVNDGITSLNLDHQGTLWIGTRQGLSLYNEETEKFYNYKHAPGDATSLAHDSVLFIFQDDQKMTWVGSQGGGISRFDPNSIRFGPRRYSEVSAKDQLPESDVRAFTEDVDGKLWIATRSTISHYDDKTGAINIIDPQLENHPISYRPILAIEADLDGLIWIGTMRGLFIFNPSEPSFERIMNNPEDPYSLPDNAITHLMRDRSGKMWLGQRTRGLSQYDPTTKKFTNFSPSPNDDKSLAGGFVPSILEDREGNIWAGTFTTGISRLLPDGGFTHYNAESHGLTNESVVALMEDQKGQIWAGTRGGLFVLRTNGQFEHFGQSQGLPNETVYGVLEDDSGHIWASTNKGLARLNPENGAIYTYLRTSGLQGNEFNANSYLKRANQTLVFGGTEGLNMFLGSEIPTTGNPAQVVLTSFKLFNKPVPYTKDGMLQKHLWETELLTLEHHQDMLSFQFSALRDSNPKALKYAYLMEGFDKTWLYTDSRNRQATYTNLPSGEYTFRVKAGTQAKWSSLEGRLELKILSPPWKTIHAYVGYVLGTLCLLGLIFWNVQRAKHILEERVAERTSQLHRQNEVLDTRNRELEAIDHIVRTINIQIEPEAVMQVLTDQIHRLFNGADRVSCFLLEPSVDAFRIVASHGFGDDAHKVNRVARTRLQDRYTRSSEQVAEGIRVARHFREKMGENRLPGILLPESLVAISIVLGGQTVGYVVIDNLSNPEAFQGSDFQILVRLRQHAIAALQRARQISDLITAQRKLADAAHAAGMAESSIDVLHHLGNKLNSVKTNTQQLREFILKDEALGMLARLSQNLAKPEITAEILADPSRFEKMRRMLDLISQKLSQQFQSMSQESANLDTILQEITQALLEQQEVTDNSEETAMIPLDLNDVVIEALENETYLLAEKDIQVEQQLSAIQPVRANRARLQRVMAYLLENAREAVPSGKGQILVTTQQNDDLGCISIIDNGTGIDMELLEAIFRDGFSTKTGRQGFGLHYCANTLKEMDGHIEVNSEGQDLGTRVTLFLPIAEET